MITFAFGDIHGCIDELNALMDEIGTYILDNHIDIDDVRLVFLGDYVDRGPDSAGVLDALMQIEIEFTNTVFLMGNHEDMMLGWSENWIVNGGWETLESFKVKHPKDIPAHYINWMKNLHLSWEDDLRYYVHGGVVPGRPLQDNSRDCKLWMREPFLSSDYMWPKLIVHGHTPIGVESKKNRLNLDSACVFGGNLTAAMFDDKEAQPQKFFVVKRGTVASSS